VLPLPVSQHHNIVCNPGGVHIRPSLTFFAAAKKVSACPAQGRR
jgi:phosphotransferase system HPr-like phosphotransfer protein